MTFRPMRRKKQYLPDEDVERILHTASSGVLCVIGDYGYPYGVPLNFVYTDGKIYFHCAKDGHKIDAIAKCPKASFTIVNMEETKPEIFATNYESVVAFGKARVIEDERAMTLFVDTLARKYSDEPEEKREAEIKSEISRMAIIEFTPEHITGKESIRQVNERNK